MSNIISFPQRIRPLEEDGRIGILIDCFWNRHRTTEDVFWLGERKRRTAQLVGNQQGDAQHQRFNPLPKIFMTA